MQQVIEMHILYIIYNALFQQQSQKKKKKNTETEFKI